MKQLENFFDHYRLITQNVDSLHRIAGSNELLELHGNILANKCADCGSAYITRQEIDPDNIPRCQSCNGKIRPDVVWFGELLDETVISAAFSESENCDVFFSAGTSAIVHPAASLPVTAKRYGALLVEVNVEPTPLSELADFRFEAPSGEFFPALVASLEKATVNCAR